MNLTIYRSKVSKMDRSQLNRQRSCVIWLTGLPGAGKSTIAAEVEKNLFNHGQQVFVLDGDNIRLGLNKNLTFKPDDRRENVRRIAEVAKLFIEAGVIVIAAVVSPFEKDRDMVKQLFDHGDFIEVFVKCSLEECERRDPKGLYKLARNKQIVDFTGVTSPYEIPLNPDIILETEQTSLEESVDTIIRFLEKGKYINLAEE
ncbi:adenylyl-sulfate kinase [Paenibacillus lautus]|uniref:adenylyl-sulfate kinase n=1 Tax=Paenibacillus lautus TaxID=1401 RepID=UPI003D277BBB